MKTLDEVIKAYEQCAKLDWEEGCGDCAYRNEKCGSCKCVRNDDALHYLKKYREEDKRLGKAINEACDVEMTYFHLIEDLERNDPLTWDELKAMEGKPVWVELTYPEGAYSHWGIIWGFPKAGYEFMELWGFHDIVSFSVMEKEQGKTWQAYRKERE